ncbi:hypothetical protein PTKIN_Ptkin01aG0309400 [Pterospermum kingtungense]
MDREGGFHGGSCYYSILGIRKDASFSDIHTAYRKFALKWHPDRYARNPRVASEVKRRFQQIQEAYSVLSDESKRSMSDVDLYDPFEKEDEVPKKKKSFFCFYLILPRVNLLPYKAK